MPMDSKLEISLLFDFYSELLNDSQKQAVDLYVNDDLSLSEAADLLGISRQGVRDSLNRAVKKMRGYESKIHMLSDYRTRYAATMKILDDVEKIRGLTDDPAIAGLCGNITDNINTAMKNMEREDPHGI